MQRSFLSLDEYTERIYYIILNSFARRWFNFRLRRKLDTAWLTNNAFLPSRSLPRKRERFNRVSPLWRCRSNRARNIRQGILFIDFAMHSCRATFWIPFTNWYGNETNGISSFFVGYFQTEIKVWARCWLSIWCNWIDIFAS